MGAARPSAAGLKTEPSVSQPPPPSAAALEQEVVSSPLHPAGMSFQCEEHEAFQLYWH